MLDGVLVIDKPAGPTSHDVVARVRRAIGISRIGHTGTLDPSATGVLPLVIGRATRLAQFLTSDRKTYEAVLQLGASTDTGDAEGSIVGGDFEGQLPTGDAIERVLAEFRGTFLQQPPAFSAKKIGGRRSYRIARAGKRAAAASEIAAPVARLPAPVAVTAYSIALTSVEGRTVALRVECSAGFYVRSLAHDIGVRLGTGAHLTALRRTRSGEFDLEAAVPLAAVESDPAVGTSKLIDVAKLLTDMPGVVLTGAGVRHATHGQPLDSADRQLAEQTAAALLPGARIRLLGPAGSLIGIADVSAAGAVLHPRVVLV